jgi:septum formation protein
MLKEKLKHKNLILASGSPRRQLFLKELDLDFEIRLKDIDEHYPSHLNGTEITDYLAKLKATPFLEELKENDLLITSDTIVWLNNKALGKPKNTADAKQMLHQLSGKKHEVISSFCITSKKNQIVKNEITQVYFSELTAEEIDYYVEKYQPFDKAGSYGIQEWIGYIGIDKIEGSFFNVMGFPIKLFYNELKNF